MNGPVIPSLAGPQEALRALVKMRSARLLLRGTQLQQVWGRVGNTGTEGLGQVLQGTRPMSTTEQKLDSDTKTRGGTGSVHPEAYSALQPAAPPNQLPPRNAGNTQGKKMSLTYVPVALAPRDSHDQMVQ